MVNGVAFYGSNTNIGNISTKPQVKYEAPAQQSLEADTVCFKGRDKEKKFSFGKVIAVLTTLSVATIAGLALAHKNNWISKLKDGKIKTHLGKASETCYGWYEQSSKQVRKYYDKVKKSFHKKS